MKKSVLALLLIALLNRSALASVPQWVEARSPHFTIISDANEKEARHVLDQLERMRWVFQTLFPNANVDPAERSLYSGRRMARRFKHSSQPLIWRRAN